APRAFHNLTVLTVTNRAQVHAIQALLDEQVANVLRTLLREALVVGGRTSRIGKAFNRDRCIRVVTAGYVCKALQTSAILGTNVRVVKRKVNREGEAHSILHGRDARAELLAQALQVAAKRSHVGTKSLVTRDALLALRGDLRGDLGAYGTGLLANKTLGGAA